MEINNLDEIVLIQKPVTHNTHHLKFVLVKNKK